jgi:prepilin-type N-terminal cleavage/methylation domain-containing protein
VQSLIARLRDEDGFGLVELLIAMTVLAVGILAIVAGYGSGYVAVRRANQISSATVLADAQMEQLRAHTYAYVALNRAGEDTTYQSDSAYSAATEIGGCSSTSDPSCLPTQTQTGPDGRSYRVDTYMNWSCLSGTLTTSPSPTCGSGQPAPVKLVTVVVRNSAATKEWAREASTFSPLTGCDPSSTTGC